VSMDAPALALRMALARNEAFYKAFETLRVEAMDRVWDREGYVRCVHPGREALVGWDAVRRSWQQVFTETSWLRVTATRVHAELIGSVAVVSCLENMTIQSESGLGIATAEATNIFRWVRSSGWQLFHHHSSAVSNPLELAISGPMQ
jgi:ketosteroid isomerase-like protein